MRVETALEKREQKYRALITDYSTDLSIKNAARAAVATVREEILEAGEPEWRHDFVLRFLEEERQKFLANTPEDHAYDDDGLREDTPLCTCNSSQCEVKNAELPTTIRTADTLAAGVHAYRREHSGEPIVLNEAMEAWRSRMAHVADVLELATMALGHEVHVLEIDGAEELLGDDHEIPPADETAEAATP